MAQVNFLPDKVAPPIDQKLDEMSARMVLIDRKLRIRVQPDFYDPDARAYTSWTGLTWVLEVDDVEEGRRLREGLAGFFKAFGDEGKQAKLLALLGKL